jgi:cysteine desulfurase
MAMRIPDDRLRSSVRFSLGAVTSEGEIDEAIKRIIQVIARIDTNEVSLT